MYRGRLGVRALEVFAGSWEVTELGMRACTVVAYRLQLRIRRVHPCMRATPNTHTVPSRHHRSGGARPGLCGASPAMRAL
jgi:hypothetical protein